MPKTKPKECIKCGCERVFTIEAKVRVHADDTAMTYNLKRLCLICLLDFMKMRVPDAKGKLRDKIDYTRAMSCVSDPEEEA